MAYSHPDVQYRLKLDFLKSLVQIIKKSKHIILSNFMKKRVFRNLFSEIKISKNLQLFTPNAKENIYIIIKNCLPYERFKTQHLSN